MPKDLISQSEFSKRSVLNRRTVKKGIDDGRLACQRVDKNIKIDWNSEKTAQFIQEVNSRKEGNSSSLQAEDNEFEDYKPDTVNDTDEYTGLNQQQINLKKGIAQTRKLEIENATKLGTLVQKKDVERAFKILYGEITSRLHPLGLILSADILSELGVTDDQKKIETKNIIDKKIESVLQSFRIAAEKGFLEGEE